MRLVKHGRGSYGCPLCGVRLRPVRLEKGKDVRQCPGCGKTVRLPKQPDFRRGSEERMRKQGRKPRREGEGG